MVRVSIAVEDDAGAWPASSTTRRATSCGRPTRDGAPRSTARRSPASARAELATALVATGFGYDADVRGSQVARRGAADAARCATSAGSGSAALDLAWTAAGRYDAYYERGVKHWDIAAGRLICARAGLAVRALAPSPPAEDGMLVAAPGLVDELAALLD